MVEELKFLSIPTKYEMQPFDDERFLKVRIHVMHEGLNKNNSFFDIDAIESAKESLKNIPVLAFVKEVDGNGKMDMAGHEMEMVLTEDVETGEMIVKTRYLGRPIGIVPEDNNYHYEIIEGRTYVVVDAYIWKDYANEALDILEQDRSKPQSMEIRVVDYNYDFENKYFKINKYLYTGLTVLGSDVTPAMDLAKVEVLNNFSQYSNEYYKMVEELKNTLQSNNQLSPNEIENISNHHEEGGEIVEEIKLATEFENEPVAEQEVEEVEEIKNEEVVEVVSEVSSEQPINEVSEEDPEIIEDQSKEVQEVEESIEESNSDNEVVEESIQEEVVDEVQESEIKEDFSTLQKEYDELKIKYESISTQLKELQEENKSLKEFKLSKERESKQELFAKFSDLTDDDLKELKENIDNYSLSELELNLFALLGKKKIEFSKLETKKEEKQHLVFGLTSGINKVANNDAPAWLEYVEQYKSKIKNN